MECVTITHTHTHAPWYAHKHVIKEIHTIYTHRCTPTQT